MEKQLDDLGSRRWQSPGLRVLDYESLCAGRGSRIRSEWDEVQMMWLVETRYVWCSECSLVLGRVVLMAWLCRKVAGLLVA